jgi:hypothetical protein
LQLALQPFGVSPLSHGAGVVEDMAVFKLVSLQLRRSFLTAQLKR